MLNFCICFSGILLNLMFWSAFGYAEHKGMSNEELFGKFIKFLIKLLFVTSYFIVLAWIAYFLLIYVFL